MTTNSLFGASLALRAATHVLTAKEQKLDLALAKQLEKDLRVLTKIYRDIPTDDSPEALKRFREARKIFSTYANNLEQTVYKKILGLKDEEGQKSWHANDLRSKAWTFIIDIGDSSNFPTSWSYRTEEYEDAPWELKSGRNNRDKNIRRYQKAAREFFVSLREYAEREGGLKMQDPYETTDIAGFRVVIHNKNRYDNDYNEKSLRETLSRLHDFKKQIKRAGFDRFFDDLQVHVSFDNSGKGSFTAGAYEPKTDKLTLYPLGLTRTGDTFIHEFGHRFYFQNLSINARKVWEQVIGDKITHVSDRAVDLWVDKYLAPFHKKTGGYLPDRREMEALVKRSDEDEVMKAQLAYLADHNPTYTDELEKIRKHHKRNVGDKVMIEHITDYGAENPLEAFAEAFKLYVMKGPGRLGPWTRQFFKDISRSGGARIRSKTEASKK